MTQLNYDMPRSLIEVKHGYTLHDLDQMTRAAVIADRSMASDIQDRKDAAWSAIAEHLCEAEEAPTRQELIRVGWQAIYKEIRGGYQEYGYAARAWDAGHASAPRFVQYWYSPVQAGHDERIIERLAAAQIAASLTQARREAVTALAVTGDWSQAAALLGISYDSFNQRIRAARRAFLALWCEGETPHWSQYNKTRRVPSTVEASTHCGNGHERTPENTNVSTRIVRGQRRTIRRCRVCEHDRSAARAAVARAKGQQASTVAGEA